MCILTETSIFSNSKDSIHMKYDDAPKICPVCGNLLKYRDRRQRIIRTEDGRTLWCTVRRFKCTNCNRLHTEIPKQLTPYKHYQTSSIEDVIDGVTDESDPATADGPSEQTMKRWRRWFSSNEDRLHGYIRNTQQKILHGNLCICHGLRCRFLFNRMLVSFGCFCCCSLSSNFSLALLFK